MWLSAIYRPSVCGTQNTGELRLLFPEYIHLVHFFFLHTSQAMPGRGKTTSPWWTHFQRVEGCVKIILLFLIRNVEKILDLHSCTLSHFLTFTLSLFHTFTLRVSHYHTIKLSHFDTLTLWHFDTLTIWQFDTLTVWHFDTLTLYPFHTFTFFRTFTI